MHSVFLMLILGKRLDHARICADATIRVVTLNFGPMGLDSDEPADGRPVAGTSDGPDSRLPISDLWSKPCVVCYQQTYPHYPQVRMSLNLWMADGGPGIFPAVKFREEFIKRNFR